MIKLMKYLKRSAGYIVIIIALLFLQAYCDLSLPNYTSNIINVGIQQNGIEDSVPEKIRKTSMDSLKLFMEEDDAKTVDGFYEEEGDDLVLKDKISKEDREELNDIFGKPMVIVSTLTSDSEESKAALAKMGIPEGTDPLAALSQMPAEALAAVKEQVGEKIDKMQESIITQAGVSYVRAEYEAMGEDVDAIQMDYMKATGIRMVLMALVTMMAAVCVVFLSSRVAASMGHDLRGLVYNKVIGFSSREYHKFSTASLITRCTNDIQQIQQVMAMMFRIVLYAPILGIGGVIRVLQRDSSMTWILGVAIVLIMAFMAMLFRIAMPKFTALQTMVDKLNLVTREILTGIPVIRAFSREKHEEERFEDANITLTKTNLFVNRCMTFMMPVMMLIMNGITILIVWSGAHGVSDGQMQVGDMMAFIQYTMQIIMSFLMICMISIMLPRAAVAADRVDEILTSRTAIEDPKTPEKLEESRKGEVKFDHVSFRYPGAEEDVLHDISFTAKPGQTTAIIGSTGSGKSTMINLIPRFYDVTEGTITLDGKDIRTISQHDLRDELGYVPQKGVLFSGTIESNILYGNPDGSEAEMKEAAEIAQATEFIEEKHKKYESPIAQGGSNVSGGQKQRLSIARAIAKKPKVYIFDDSFSALDYKTDVTLRAALKEKTQDSTVIIVAQRISTILHAEQIIVLDDGKIAGIGTHKELLKSCDAYYQIASSQLSEAELARDLNNENDGKEEA